MEAILTGVIIDKRSYPKINIAFKNWEKWKDKAADLGYTLSKTQDTPSTSGNTYTYWVATHNGKTKRLKPSDIAGEFSSYNQKGWLYAGLDVP